MAGYFGSNSILFFFKQRNANTFNTASKCPSLFMTIYDPIIDTLVVISTLNISTIHLIIPIKDWYQDASSFTKAGVSSISGAYFPTKGFSDFFFGNCQRVSANSARYFSKFATNYLTYLSELFAHVHSPF